MKKLLSVLCAVSLLWIIFPVEAVFVAAQEQPTASVIVNVKDFGAVGDGVTDDRAAMMAAFDYAVINYAAQSIPVTVYFPAGRYGLVQGGMYIKMPYGAGNLTIKGDGADESAIVYLEEWDNGGTWVAIRLQLAEEPASVDDYLHDIVIQDLGVVDTDPAKHAWHTDKGDPSTEETHGFNIQHCVRATIRNCKTVDIGDECFDMTHCIDSLMTQNLVIKYRVTGKGGGSISVGDGSRNVRVTDNTVLFETEHTETCHYGIAVEALAEQVEEVYIRDNVLTGLDGWGINIGAPRGTIADVLVQNNTMIGCLAGGLRFMGSGLTERTHITDNTMREVGVGILLDGKNKNETLIENCTIDTVADCGVRISSPGSNDTVIRNVTITASQHSAFYNAGTNTEIDRVRVNGVGLGQEVTAAAITQYSHGGNCRVSNTLLLDCRNKKGIQGVQSVVNTMIEQAEVSGYVSIQGADVVKQCKVNRIIQAKNGCTIDGLVLYTEQELGTHAITLSDQTYCTVTDCRITVPSRYAVYEIRQADYNRITDNVIVGGSGIKVVGANTVMTDNVMGSMGTTDGFAYRVANGEVTITEWLDRTSAQIVIPATVEGYPVTAIEPWAFALWDDLTSVTIPGDVTAVGANAFYGCDGLADVCYLGNAVEWGRVAVGENNEALLAAMRCYAANPYSDAVYHSVMDTQNGNGLAFRFELCASGVTAQRGHRMDLTNATLQYLGEEYKLIAVGAVVTNDETVGEQTLTLDAVNGSTVLDVPTVYLQEWTDNACTFATRIINIPSSALDSSIYARPYCIIEKDGESIAVYGDVDIATCREYM